MAPKFAQDVYRTGPLGFGMVLAAQGIGTFVATGYFALRRKSIKTPGLWLITASIVQMIGCIGFSFTQTTLLGVISIFSLGIVAGVFTVTHTSIILLTSPANRWGRVMGFQVVMMGLYPFGSLLLGLTADTIGLSQAIRLFAVLGLISLMVIWFRYKDLRKPI
jgi:MFS family permease